MKHWSLTAFSLLLLAACNTTEPTSYNAGLWTSAPLPSGSVTTFSLDTTGSVIRGEGATTGIAGHGSRSFSVQGLLTFRQVVISFRYKDGTTYDYLARYDGATTLVGSISSGGAPLADSVKYFRR